MAFLDGEYVDSYRRAVRARLLSFCEAKYLACDVQNCTVDVRALYQNALPRIVKCQKPRVLIVMRDYFNAAATAIMMQRFGCVAVICKTGRQAYQKYLRHNSSSFHLCIVEWNMEDVSGRDLVYYEREKGGDLVFLAAVPEKMPAEEVVRSGADLFLRKPLCIHMHVLRGMLLPNLESSYAFPVSVMKMKPHNQEIKNLLENFSKHTAMDKETDEVLKEANQLLYSTQDAVLDANMNEFNGLLSKLSKVVQDAKEVNNQRELTGGAFSPPGSPTGGGASSRSGFAASSGNLLLAATSSQDQRSASRLGGNQRGLHPSRAPSRAASSANLGAQVQNEMVEHENEKLSQENKRLQAAFGAALRTFNEMKAELTQLLHYRQQLKRLLTKKPELNDIVSPFDPGSAIDTMEREELIRVINQLRHHCCNLVAENQQLAEDYERVVHFRVELEEDFNNSGLTVSFTDVSGVVVANDDHTSSYAEHAIKLLMAGEKLTDEERDEMKKFAQQNVVAQFRKNAKNANLASPNRRKSVSISKEQQQLEMNRIAASGGSRRESVVDVMNPAGTFFRDQLGSFSSGGALTTSAGGGGDSKSPSFSLTVDEFPTSTTSNASGSPTAAAFGGGGERNNRDPDDEPKPGLERLASSLNPSMHEKYRAKRIAADLLIAREEFAMASKVLKTYERTQMELNDKYVKSALKTRAQVPDKVPFHLQPIAESSAPHDVEYSQMIKFVQRSLDATHSFVERAVTVTPSLYMKAEEYMRSLNGHVKNLNLEEVHEKCVSYMRDRNIRERTSLTEGFQQLKDLRAQLAASKQLPLRDLVLIRKAEVLRRNASRALVRQLKANVQWHVFRAWGLWARNRKIQKEFSSHQHEVEAMKVKKEREVSTLVMKLKNEERAHQNKALEVLRSESKIEALQKQVKQLQTQDALKDRTIARLNDKLLGAVALAKRQGNEEQLQILSFGRDVQDAETQTLVDVESEVKKLVEEHRQKERVKAKYSPQVSIQCELMSDAKIEQTIDSAIRSFVATAQKMNIINRTEPPSSSSHDVLAGSSSSSSSPSSSSSAAQASEGATSVTTGFARRKSLFLPPTSENEGGDGGEGENEDSSPSSTPMKRGVSSLSSSVLKRRQSISASPLSSPSNSSSPSSPSKAKERWNKLLNRENLNKLVARIAKETLQDSIKTAMQKMRHVADDSSSVHRIRPGFAKEDFETVTSTKTQQDQEGEEGGYNDHDDDHTWAITSTPLKGKIKKGDQEEGEEGDDEDDGEEYNDQEEGEDGYESKRDYSGAFSSSSSSGNNNRRKINNSNKKPKKKPPPKPEMRDVGIVTDEHGLADAIASLDEIEKAHAGLSRKRLQQQREAAKFPTVTEAAKSVNELQRFSKIMRDKFGFADLHFYFEKSNPTTLEVVREVVRGVAYARIEAQRIAASRNQSPYSRFFHHAPTALGSPTSPSASASAAAMQSFGSPSSASGIGFTNVSNIPSFEGYNNNNNINNQNNNTLNSLGIHQQPPSQQQLAGGMLLPSIEQQRRSHPGIHYVNNNNTNNNSINTTINNSINTHSVNTYQHRPSPVQHYQPVPSHHHHPPQQHHSRPLPHYASPTLSSAATANDFVPPPPPAVSPLLHLDQQINTNQQQQQQQAQAITTITARKISPNNNTVVSSSTSPHPPQHPHPSQQQSQRQGAGTTATTNTSNNTARRRVTPPPVSLTTATATGALPANVIGYAQSARTPTVTSNSNNNGNDPIQASQAPHQQNQQQQQPRNWQTSITGIRTTTTTTARTISPSRTTAATTTASTRNPSSTIHQQQQPQPQEQRPSPFSRSVFSSSNQPQQQQNSQTQGLHASRLNDASSYGASSSSSSSSSNTGTHHVSKEQRALLRKALYGK